MSTPFPKGGPDADQAKAPPLTVPRPAQHPTPTLPHLPLLRQTGVKSRVVLHDFGHSARSGARAGAEGTPHLMSQTHLLQGFLSSSFVFQAHVQPPQLQPHGGHVEGVQRVVFAGRREEDRPPSKAAEPGACAHGRRAPPGPGRFWADAWMVRP